ncbi:hypothetical protein PG995_007636 [Apiospora arundinis]
MRYIPILLSGASSLRLCGMKQNWRNVGVISATRSMAMAAYVIALVLERVHSGAAPSLSTIKPRTGAVSRRRQQRQQPAITNRDGQTRTSNQICRSSRAVKDVARARRMIGGWSGGWDAGQGGARSWEDDLEQKGRHQAEHPQYLRHTALVLTTTAKHGQPLGRFHRIFAAIRDAILVRAIADEVGRPCGISFCPGTGSSDLAHAVRVATFGTRL